MENIINCREDLMSYIKSIILKYCPYMEDRLSILGSSKSPELDIEIKIYNNESRVMFMFGNYHYKESVTEYAITSYVISSEEIFDIIDFLLEDHEVIKDINLYNKKIDLKFSINWTDKSIKGINCNDIGLNLNFENMELKKQYLYFLFQKYYAYLEQTPSFRAMKNEYINNIKYSYFDSLDKTTLISLLNRMCENELKELLLNLDNDLFIKYAMNDEEQQKKKILSLENKNN